MPLPSFQSGKNSYQPLNGAHRQINPSLDFTDDLAIVTVPLPSIVTSAGKKQTTEFANYTKNEMPH